MVISSLVCVLLAGDGRSWQPVPNKEGLHLEQRELAGSPYYEYRITVDTELSPGALCDGLYEWGSVGRDHEQLRARRLLEDHGEWRLVYDEIATPAPVAPRDVAFIVRRERKPDGYCKVTFTSTDDQGPPPRRGFVRLERLAGFWKLEPRPGGTRLTYVIHSDPGGGLPSHLVHGPQREAALKTVQKGLAHGRRAMTGARRP